MIYGRAELFFPARYTVRYAVSLLGNGICKEATGLSLDMVESY